MKFKIKNKSGSKKELGGTHCAQIGAAGMCDSLTNTTGCALMRQSGGEE